MNRLNEVHQNSSKRRLITAALLLLCIGVISSAAALLAAEEDPKKICETKLKEQPFEVYGWISGVYCAYNRVEVVKGEKQTVNPLGNSTDDVKEWEVKPGMDFFYQDFAHGRIYLDRNEKSAFALFWDTNEKYKSLSPDEKKELGFPITSQIDGPNDCRAYFDNGFIDCNGNWELWSTYGWRFGENSKYHDLPKMLFPKAVKVNYNGGPHEWANKVFAASISVDSGSGIDLGLASGRVVAVAPGTVIDIDRSGRIFAGGHVAIRSDFSGVVIIYGHVAPDSRFVPGVWVAQGMEIATVNEAQNHLHLELRDGSRSTCANSSQVCWGAYIGWDGIIIDDYMITSIFKQNEAAVSNYNGAALRVKDLQLPQSVKYSTSIQGIILSGHFDYVKCTNEGLPVYSWVASKDDPVCDFGRQADGKAVYANSRVNDELDNPNRLHTQSINEEDAWLQSSAVERPWQPRPMIPDPGSNPGDPGGTPSACPSDGRDGVYFYAGKQYQPPCVFSTVNIPDFSASIGDNALRSIKIVGNFQVKIHPEKDYGGDSDELNQSEADITWRSHGDSISSAKVIDKGGYSDCPAGYSQDGLYLYAGKNYEPPCVFTTTDIPDLGTTRIGDNNLSSIYVKGLYTARFYEHRNYDGRSDDFSGNSAQGRGDPNLDQRSIGSQISSVKIEAQSGAELVSNVWTASGSHEFFKCKIGRTYYVDRDYVITGVNNADDEYAHRWCIKTANADKSRSDEIFMTFELKKDATIYIWFDRRMTSPPQGISPYWSQNSKQIDTDDGPMDYFVVYSCKSAPGVVKLPGPKFNGGDGIGSMYVIAFGEESPGEGQQLCTTAAPTPTPTYTPAPTPTPTATYQPTAISTPDPRDAYEEDAGFGNAWYLTVGEPQERSIAPTADKDYARFHLFDPSAITLWTSDPARTSMGLDSDADTVMELYDENGQLLLTDDDSGDGNHARISLSCEQSLTEGTYFVIVKAYNDTALIPNYYLNLSATTCAAPVDERIRLFLPQLER